MTVPLWLGMKLQQLRTSLGSECALLVHLGFYPLEEGPSVAELNVQRIASIVVTIISHDAAK